MTAFLAVAFAWNGIAYFTIYCRKSPMVEDGEPLTIGLTLNWRL